jgi:hypothetical protein
MQARSDASLKTPYNRMAFRQAATHFGLGYQRTSSHAMIPELIYTAGALAPFAVGMATPDPNKRFMTLRSIAVAEAVALLFYEIATHHGNLKNQAKRAGARTYRPAQAKAPISGHRECHGQGHRARHGAVTHGPACNGV